MGGDLDAPAEVPRHPSYRERYGPMLGFDWVTPRWRPADAYRWQVPLPRFSAARAHPVGLRHDGEPLIAATCPPYSPTMAAAVDDVFAGKFGPTYLDQASDYAEDVVACARDICTYVHETHGRFPAHVEAIHAPGVWLQAHHVEQPYYERFFRNGLTDAHLSHDRTWHAG